MSISYRQGHSPSSENLRNADISISHGWTKTTLCQNGIYTSPTRLRLCRSREGANPGSQPCQGGHRGHRDTRCGFVPPSECMTVLASPRAGAHARRARDTSPAIYRWGTGATEREVPSGTKERPGAGLLSPLRGLRSFRTWGPTVETMGYSRSSLPERLVCEHPGCALWPSPGAGKNGPAPPRGFLLVSWLRRLYNRSCLRIEPALSDEEDPPSEDWRC